MYERFNNNFQNIQPEQDPNIDPYQEQYFGQNDPTPYIQAMNVPVPGGLDQNNFYPLEPSLATPSLSTQILPNSNARNNYAKGGEVKRQKKKRNLPSLAENIRQKGRRGDTLLAHINPLEAMMLKEAGGSGTINPETGLPEFSFWNKPFKAIKSVLGGGAGAIAGNMLLPGIGGIIGGALGQGVQHASRGKSPIAGAIKGAGIGALVPTASSLLGSGASALGAEGLGSTLSNYGERNAILPALDRLLGTNIGASSGNPLSAAISAPSRQGEQALPLLTKGVASGATKGAEKAAEQSFLDSLIGNSKKFLTKPANLLTLGVLGSSFLNRPKEKSPEQLAAEHKRFQQALLLSPEEQRKKEAAELAEEQSKRRVARNKFLPEERFNIEPVYRKTHSPEEHKKSGKWFTYYNNPEFSGSPLPYKKGGMVPHMEYEEAEVKYPNGLGYYMKGETGGQDDKKRVKLPNGAYVVDASTVANIGDGNSDAGAKKIDAYISDGEYVIPPQVVTNKFGKGNNEKGAQSLDKMIRNIRKHKGGSVKLPPKAKSLASYMR